jgi:hypothetical protein
MRRLKMPPSHGVSAGPKIVAAQIKMFSSLSGAALAPYCDTKLPSVSTTQERLDARPGLASWRCNDYEQNQAQHRVGARS